MYLVSNITVTPTASHSGPFPSCLLESPLSGESVLLSLFGSSWNLKPLSLLLFCTTLPCDFVFSSITEYILSWNVTYIESYYKYGNHNTHYFKMSKKNRALVG